MCHNYHILIHIEPCEELRFGQKKLACGETRFWPKRSTREKPRCLQKIEKYIKGGPYVYFDFWLKSRQHLKKKKYGPVLYIFFENGFCQDPKNKWVLG